MKIIVKTMNVKKPLIVTALLLLVAGCATAPEPHRYDFDDPATAGIEAWIAGQAAEALTAESTQVDRFLAGEHLYWSGDLEAAYDVYVSMFLREPGHPLNRYAAQRLQGLRHDVMDFSRRLIDDLGEQSFAEESGLTRYVMARVFHHAHRAEWGRKLSDAEPFSFERAGVIPLWRATPRLSPWRLQDFDTAFEPEETESLAERYRSPRIASAHPANWRPVQTVHLDAPGNRLSLGRSGVYYLESFLEVDQAGSFLVAGHFPAATKVWIGDQEVFARREEGYESGRLFREVELTEGSHRVLLKISLQPRFRDWFELFLVPEDLTGERPLRPTLTPESSPGRVALRGPAMGPMELEPVTPPESRSAVSSPTLYALSLSAHANGESELFEEFHGELMERHPEFVPGILLGSLHIRTRWDVPSELREARSLAMVRRALEVDPDNLQALVRLERGLRDQANDREHRRVLERARELAMGRDFSRADRAPDASGAAEAGEPQQDPLLGGGRPDESIPRFDGEGLRQIRPLVVWATYLERQGWSADAEDAWREVLLLEPSNCAAARQLMGLYDRRRFAPHPEEITPDYQRCPSLLQRWADAHPDRIDDALRLDRWRAEREPYHSGYQRALAATLRSAGNLDGARAVLDEARARMPADEDLLEARVELALLEDDLDGARAMIDEQGTIFGRSAGTQWQRARINGEIPLQSLMYDGHELARQEVERSGDLGTITDEADDLDEESMVLDDAYYVLNFRARHHLDDGSVWTLTHQIVRVMTRGAIDRYAEISVPGGAYLLQARTIKEDGETRVPEDVPGKSTLSMPGLAEGDMVELAYLQFQGPSEVPSHSQGPIFTFQNLNISSRLSELVLIDAEDLSVESANGAPSSEPFEWEGLPALRFEARDVRRPRSEPRRVNAVEFLPWVREVRIGLEGHVLDAERRYHRETLIDSTRDAPIVRRTLTAWLGQDGRRGITDEEVRRLFYATAAHFRSPSPGSFSTDAAHALEHRRGSPLVLLKTLLDITGVASDVYLGRSDSMPPEPWAMGEIQRYRKPLLRVEMPASGEVVWLEMGRRDAMFGAVEAEVVGEPAVCLTCEEFREEIVAIDEDRRAHRRVKLEGALGDDGTLRGTVHYVFRGARAVVVRSALRGRPDEEDRRRYFERILTDELEGATLTGVEILHEADPDVPLEFTISFERPRFARVDGDRLIIDRPVFREAMQRIYAPLATRESAMFVGYERDQDYTLSIELPAGRQANLRARDLDEAIDEGRFERRAWVDGDTLRLESAIFLGRQRIYPERYGAFRQWATAVEESAEVWLELR